MPLNSINTNSGAFAALQNLNSTNRELATTQSRINTGQRVASAKDNGAIYAIASKMRADSAGIDSLKNSVARGQSVVEVSLAAGETIMTALKEAKTAAAAFNSTTDADTKAAYKATITNLKAEIAAAEANAKFDGSSLLAGGTLDVKTGFGTAATDKVAITGAAAVALDDTDANITEANIDAKIKAFGTSLNAIGAAAKTLDRTSTFLEKNQDAIDNGVGNLVDADLAKESAKLQALQTKQQLGVQALSIANQSSGSLLGLFR
ncbi:MAG: flagellin [Asticcacaulis sp.]